MRCRVLWSVTKWCLDPESNQGHEDFQSSALPTELSRHIYVRKERKWCRLPESNWRPTDYKSVALPTELSRRHQPIAGIFSCTHSFKEWCLDPESNQGHEDFQSSALPTELSRHKVLAANIHVLNSPTWCGVY